MKHLSRAAFLLCAVEILARPLPASACAVCMGGPDSNVTPALNASIFLMLGLVGFMSGLVGLFVFQLARRAKAPLPPHAQLNLAEEI